MKQNKKAVAAVWAIGFVLVWETFSFLLCHLSKDANVQSKLPYLHTIMLCIAENAPLLLQESAVTLSNAAAGFTIGAGVGVLIAILMSLSDMIEKVAFPYLILSQMIPVLGLAPIIYGIVHDENASRIIIAGYITFFPVSIHVLSALKSVKKEEKDLLYCYAVKRPKTYQKLMFPSALPSLFSGLKIAAPLSITSAILVELMGAQHGIGVLILRNLYYGSSRATTFWAAVLVSGFLGVFSYGMIGLVEYFAIPWHNTMQKEGAI